MDLRRTRWKEHSRKKKKTLTTSITLHIWSELLKIEFQTTRAFLFTVSCATDQSTKLAPSALLKIFYTPTPSTWYRILPIQKPTLFDGQMHKTSCMYTFALLDEFCSKAGKIREVKCLSDLKSSLFMYYIVVFDIDVKINDNERVLSILWH